MRMSNFYVIGKAYGSCLENLGIDSELVFKKAEIPVNSTAEDGIAISKDQYIRFMEAMDQVVTDEQILALGDIDKILMFIPPLFAAMCSKNGLNCYERISKYKELIGPFAIHLIRDESTLTLNMEFSADKKEIPLPRFSVLSEQVLMVGIIRKATGLHIVPQRVVSRYDYGDGSLEEYFGVAPEKGDENLLVFRIEDVEEPFLTRNNSMWEYIEPELKRRLKELQKDESYSAKVRTILHELIPAGRGDIDDVAKEMAVSSRTLQRKLSSENTTFIKQLNHTRELMARNFLKDRRISNDEIAFLIGYSDANAFSRAFRGWTGMTVGEYRKQAVVQ